MEDQRSLDNLVLEMKGVYVALPALQPAPADGSSCYRLYGVVEHQGSFKGGHYVAFVKASPSGVWHRMSDSTVSRVDEETALKAQAFLLFYELVK